MSQDSITAFTVPVVSSNDTCSPQDISDSITINAPTFEELYETYYDYVRRRICTLLRYHPRLIDDALQETWIKVWRFLPDIKSNHNLKAWLWLIATNTVRDAMRRYTTWEMHHSSLEGALDHFEISPDNYRHAIVADPHEYIPEQVERHALRARIWSKLSVKDKRTFAAYVENEPFDVKDLYSARRNFSDRYKRAVEREKREVAS
jgi:RNA polymerase sigma factor (sigma-70 family)